MEEMKSMLIKLCEGQERLENHYLELKEEQTAMKEQQIAMRKEQTAMKEQQITMLQEHKTLIDEHKDMKEAIHYLIELQKEMRKEMRQGFRVLNERLAVCQLQNGKKVDVLFDADETRKQHLEQHDKEIPKIKSTLYEHAMRIKKLESRIVGA